MTAARSDAPWWRSIRRQHLGAAFLIALFCAAAIFDEEWDRALVTLQRALTNQDVETAKNPLLSEAQRLLEKDRGSERAYALLARAVDGGADGGLVFWLGEVHFQRGENAAAAEQFERALASDPAHLPAWLKLSAVHERDGRLAAATQVLEQGLAAIASAQAANPRSPASARVLQREIRRIESKR